MSAFSCFVLYLLELIYVFNNDKDLYQKDIAKILNTTQQVYSEYELGIRLLPIDKLDILATFYNTSTDYILGRTNIKEPYERR